MFRNFLIITRMLLFKLSFIKVCTQQGMYWCSLTNTQYGNVFLVAPSTSNDGKFATSRMIPRSRGRMVTTLQLPRSRGRMVTTLQWRW
jgi:hypothetical protein